MLIGRFDVDGPIVGDEKMDPSGKTEHELDRLTDGILILVFINIVVNDSGLALHIGDKSGVRLDPAHKGGIKIATR